MKGRRFLLDDPVAVTSGGNLILNLAYVEDAHSVNKMIAVLRRNDNAGCQFFVGIGVSSPEAKKAMKMLDDFCAELAATIKIGHRPQ